MVQCTVFSVQCSVASSSGINHHLFASSHIFLWVFFLSGTWCLWSSQYLALGYHAFPFYQLRSAFVIWHFDSLCEQDNPSPLCHWGVLKSSCQATRIVISAFPLEACFIRRTNLSMVDPENLHVPFLLNSTKVVPPWSSSYRNLWESHNVAAECMGVFFSSMSGDPCTVNIRLQVCQYSRCWTQFYTHLCQPVQFYLLPFTFHPNIVQAKRFWSAL